MGLVIALHDAEQRQVNQAAGEGHTDTDIQDMHEHIGQTGIHTVHGIHNRRNEEEGELQRLGNTGQHGGQGRGKQQAGHDLALLGAGGAVHGQRRARQAENHEYKFAGHETGCFHRELSGRLGSQFGEEDILRPLHGHAINHGAATHGGLPERHIEHMVQAKGDQRPFDQAIDKGARIPGADHQIAQHTDAGLHNRPDIEHRNAHQQVYRRADDRHKAGTAEEGQHLRQLDFVKAVVQPCHAQPDDDAAKHPHLQRGNPQHGCCGVGRHCFDAAGRIDHGADGGIHDQIGDGAGQGRDLLFFFGHTDGNAHGKQQGQVVEHGAAALVHDIQNRVDHRALVDQACQAIGFEHGLVGEGTADPEQQPRHRQQGYGQHKGAAHPL